jgi:hypothetical protein
MRTCSKCKKTEGEVQFYKTGGYCKECSKIYYGTEKRKNYYRKYCLKNKKRLQEYHRKYYLNNKKKIYFNHKKWLLKNPGKSRDYWRTWMLKNLGCLSLRNTKYGNHLREVDKEYARNKRALGLVDKTEESRIWNIKNPNGNRAHQIINYYIRVGKIKRGICECGKINTYAHHEDYNKPLEVKWMCPSCHKKYHLSRSAINSKITN